MPSSKLADQASVSGKPNSRLLLSIGELPALPAGLAEILRIANDPDATIGELESVVNRDLSLAARVLQVANSVLYGSRNIATLSRAMRLLGIHEVQNIAASMAVSPQFQTHPGTLIDGSALWRHALACGLWTQIVAKRLSFFQVEHLYTAGLLHDIGLLVLAKVEPEGLAAALESARSDPAQGLLAAEQAVLDTNHARVGAMVCAKWMLPPQLTQLIANHHSHSSASGPAAHVLALAEHLACASSMGEFEWAPANGAAPDHLLDVTGLEPGDIDELLERADHVRRAVEEIDTVTAAA